MSSEGQSKDEQTLVPPVLWLGLRSDALFCEHRTSNAERPTSKRETNHNS